MNQKDPTPQVGTLPPPRKKLGRRATIIGSLIAVIVLGGLGWLAWDLTHPEKPAAASGASRPAGGGGRGGGGGGRRGGAPATTVGVAVAESADIPVVLDALGTVLPAATVTVRPQVGGVLKEVLFKEGQMVKAGQLLAALDARQFEMALMQASGQRQRDEASLEAAKVTLQRFRTLLEQDSIARQEVDTQAALVKQLEGTLVIDRAAEGTARINLGYTRIVAPISGRLGLRIVDPGNVVGANDPNGIVVITQVSPIDVQFAVPQDQVPEFQARTNAGANMPVTALDRTRDATLDNGRFSTLDNQIDTQTGTVRAKARFDNAKGNLFPNQFVNVRVLLRTITGGVVVPVTALRNGSAGDFVYVLNDDRTVSLRTVKRGQATVDKIEIRTGLKVGERVITEGADRLKDGVRVMLAGDRQPAAGERGAGNRGERGRRGQQLEGAAGVPAAGAPVAGTPAANAPAVGSPAAGAPATPAGAAAAAGATGAASGAATARPADPADATPRRRRDAQAGDGAAPADATDSAPRRRRRDAEGADPGAAANPDDPPRRRRRDAEGAGLPNGVNPDGTPRRRRDAEATAP